MLIFSVNTISSQQPQEDTIIVPILHKKKQGEIYPSYTAGVKEKPTPPVSPPLLTFYNSTSDTRCGSFPHTKLFCDTTWVFYNLNSFWRHLLGDHVRSHRLRAQTHKVAPSPHEPPNASPGCHLCFWWNSSPLSFYSFAEVAQGTQEIIYLPGYRFLIRYASGPAMYKRCTGQGTGKEGGAPSLSLAVPLSPPPSICQPQLSPNSNLSGFFGGFIT